MNILFYNWVDYDDKQKRGGGVTVYQKNVIDEVSNSENSAFFVSSGMEYDLFKKETYYRKEIRGKVTVYTIVNSPILSPAHAMFDSLDIVLNDTKVKRVFDEIIKDIGNLDVIHFNNIEGLGIKTLELKHSHPEIKFVLSTHNYHSICPQVNLWKNETENCKDNNGGKDCLNCVKNTPRVETHKLYKALETALERAHISPQHKLSHLINKCISLGMRIIVKAKRIYSTHKIKNTPQPKNAGYHKEYIDTSIAYVNKYIDDILCVSKRVAEICISRGMLTEKLTVSYIGTKFADLARYVPNHYENEAVTFCYLGYMRRDKGFYFLMDALEALPYEISNKMNFIIAARFTDPEAVVRLNKLSNKFSSFELLDGYDHSTLPAILEKTNIGLVPVLWEDNLPQVAIEFYAHGVSVLCSDLGGSQELSTASEFSFNNGDIVDLVDKIRSIVVKPELIDEYFNYGLKLRSMSQHMDELNHIYGAKK